MTTPSDARGRDKSRASIVVTFFDQGSWVYDALDSVLAQSVAEVRLVITDDGSSDNTREQVLRWLDEHEVDAAFVTSDRNIGLPAMLNRAIPYLEGDYVIILNGDDWMEPERVELQAAALDASPADMGIAYSDIREVDADGKPTGKVFPAHDTRRLDTDTLRSLISEPSLIGMGQVMFRRSLLADIGPWDERLMADDFDFVLRAAAAGWGFAYVPGIVLNFRRYEGSMTNSSNQARLAAGRVEALKKLLGRDRETDRAILDRVTELSVVLWSLGHAPKTVRTYLRLSVLRRPSRRGVRALVESHLRMPPGWLSPRRWRHKRKPDTREPVATDVSMDRNLDTRPSGQ